MQNEANEYLKGMCDICIKKYALMKDIFDITEKQTLTIAEEDLEELNKLISIKQQKIDEINAIDEQFASKFEELKRLLNVKGLDEITAERFKDINADGIMRLQGAVKEIISLVKNIKEAEDKNNKSVKIMFKEVSDKLKNINTGKEVRKAYTQQYNNISSVYFDKKIGK